MTTPKVNGTHDLVTNRDGTVTGFRLEPRSFKTLSANDFTARFQAGGKPTYNDMDNWLVEELKDWSHGLGSEYYRDDLAVFLDGLDVETAVADQITLPAVWRVSDNGFVAYCFLDSGNYCFASGATSIRYYNPTNDTWTNAKTAIGQATDLVEFKQDVYAAFGNGAVMKTCADPSGAPTVWTDLAVNGQRLAVWNGKLWRSYNNDLYSTADGTTWGAAVKVGDPNEDVTSLAVQDGRLLVGKASGLYVSNADGSSFSDLLTSLPHYANNFLRMRSAYDNWLYFPSLSDVYKVSGVSSSAVLSRLTPRFIGNDTFGWGTPVAFAGSSKYLFALFTNVEGGGYSVVLKHNGQGWHRAWTSAAGKTATALYSSRVAARLFVCDGTSVHAQRTVTLNDSHYPDYDTGAGGTLYFAHHNALLADIDKAYKDLVVVSENLTPTINAVFSYQADRDGNWVALGAATLNPETTIPFGGGTAVHAKDLQLKCVLSTNNAAVTPKLKGLYLRYMPRPNRIYAVSANAILEDGQELLDGTTEPQTAAEKLTELRNLANAKTPFTLDTPDNLQHKAFVTAVNWQEIEAVEV